MILFHVAVCKLFFISALHGVFSLQSTYEHAHVITEKHSLLDLYSVISLIKQDTATDVYFIDPWQSSVSVYICWIIFKVPNCFFHGIPFRK